MKNERNKYIPSEEILAQAITRYGIRFWSAQSAHYQQIEDET